MNDTYLIPANSKKSILIFGIFRPFDLIMFGTGGAITLLLLLVLPLDSIALTLIAVAPGMITGFLVLPVPNYYNVRTFILTAWRFYTSRQKYIWKGWCFVNEQSDKK